MEEATDKVLAAQRAEPGPPRRRRGGEDAISTVIGASRSFETPGSREETA